MFVLTRLYKFVVIGAVSLAWLALIVLATGNQRAQAVTDTHNCGAVLPHHNVVTYTVDYAGTERRFYVLQPATYSSSVATPLVFAFHGGGGSAIEWLCHRDDIRNAAESEGFLAVYPNGLRRSGAQGFYWDQDENTPYSEYLIDWLVGHYNIDQARIYATGFSGGAQHSFELVADPKVSRRLAAIGTVAGKIGGTGYLTEAHTNLDPDLTQGEATSAFLWQGALDAGTLINGEQITHPTPSYFIPFAEKVQIYADHLGASFQTAATITNGVVISTYQNSTSGGLFKAAVDPALTHAWPNYPVMALFWDFFEQAPTQTITHNTGTVAHLAMRNALQPATSVNVSDIITFETTIYNSGGESVNLARLWTITEPMPAGFQPTSRPLVEVIQGNVIPIRSRLDRNSKSWVWQGVLGQDAVVRVRIPGRVRRCPADGVIHGQAIIFRHDPILPQDHPQLVAWDIVVNGCGVLPAIEPLTTHTVTLTEQGFVPASLRVAAGSVVEWVNATEDWRSLKSSSWESGLLISGDSSKVQVGSAGTLTFSDGVSTATLVVSDEVAGAANNVFLPVLSR